MLAHHGNIWRVDATTGQQTKILFTAEVDQMIAEPRALRVSGERLDAHGPPDPRRKPSPNGKRLVFSALDRLWIMDLPSGTPKRLTTSDGEHSPVWSPDGVHRVRQLDGGGRRHLAHPAVLPAKAGEAEATRQTAYYDEIAYSPNGQRIVATRGAARAARHRER